jgi:hypothetical protein
VLQQRDQRFDLRLGIGLVHRLVPCGEPVRIAAGVDEFDADRARVVAARVVRDAADIDPLVHAAVAVDVEMAAVAGAAGVVMHLLAVAARGGEVGQLGTVQDDEVQLRGGRASRRDS